MIFFEWIADGWHCFDLIVRGNSEWAAWVQAAGSILAIYYAGHQVVVAGDRAEKERLRALDEHEGAIGLVINPILQSLVDISAKATKCVGDGSGSKGGEFQKMLFDKSKLEISIRILAESGANSLRDPLQIQAAIKGQWLAASLVHIFSVSRACGYWNSPELIKRMSDIASYAEDIKKALG